RGEGDADPSTDRTLDRPAGRGAAGDRVVRDGAGVGDGRVANCADELAQVETDHDVDGGAAEADGVLDPRDRCLQVGLEPRGPDINDELAVDHGPVHPGDVPSSRDLPQLRAEVFCHDLRAGQRASHGEAETLAACQCQGLAWSGYRGTVEDGGANPRDRAARAGEGVDERARVVGQDIRAGPEEPPLELERVPRPEMR